MRHVIGHRRVPFPFGARFDTATRPRPRARRSRCGDTVRARTRGDELAVGGQGRRGHDDKVRSEYDRVGKVLRDTATESISRGEYERDEAVTVSRLYTQHVESTLSQRSERIKRKQRGWKPGA